MTARLTLALLITASLCAPAFADPQEITDQRSSFLGAGVRFSADKPGFRGQARDIRESERVKKATAVDPMEGGLITKQLMGMGGDVEYRYRYEYPYDDGSVLFESGSVGLLCEKCKAKAVLQSCEACEGKPFAKLCDKCKAKAILEACDDCRAKIKGAPKKKAADAKKPSHGSKKSAKKRAAEAAVEAGDPGAGIR